MKIATNVQRDAFGGITISNLALFDWLQTKKDIIVGIELINVRHILGPIVFRHYLPSFFRHHIINGIDIIARFSWEKMGNPRKRWDVVIEAIKDVLRQEEPDVILINGTYNASWILTQAAKELGIPIVLRYHGVLHKEIINKNYFIRRRLLKYEKWIAAAADAIIFPSLLCKRVVENEILKAPAKYGFVIPNPVSLSKNSKKFKRQTQGRFTIASIGRWSFVKNFQAYISLHKELIKERWPHRAILVTSFKDLHFKIPETIEQRSPMSHNDIIRFYYDINLLVVPSHFETFCNVAAEALVNGTPVLVSKNVGFSEVLYKCGLENMVIDSFNDPQKVAVAVRNLAKIKLSESKIKKVVSLLEPQLIHERILKVLNIVSKVK